MLTTAHKAAILQKTGVAVPALPAGIGEALREWSAAVDSLFVSYVAARAAKSLRDAEELRQLELLRRISASPSRGADRMQWT